MKVELTKMLLCGGGDGVLCPRCRRSPGRPCDGHSGTDVSGTEVPFWRCRCGLTYAAIQVHHAPEELAWITLPQADDTNADLHTLIDAQRGALRNMAAERARFRDACEEAVKILSTNLPAATEPTADEWRSWNLAIRSRLMAALLNL